MSREEVRSQWKAHVEEFRESGQTAAEWCRAHNLSVVQFRRWIHKFAVQGAVEPTSPAVRWLSVKMEGSSNIAVPEPVITIRIGTASIEVQDGFNPALLKQVVLALAE